MVGLSPVAADAAVSTYNLSNCVAISLLVILLGFGAHISVPRRATRPDNVGSAQPACASTNSMSGYRPKSPLYSMSTTVLVVSNATSISGTGRP
jgi:hypothetical protein